MAKIEIFGFITLEFGKRKSKGWTYDRILKDLEEEKKQQRLQERINGATEQEKNKINKKRLQELQRAFLQYPEYLQLKQIFERPDIKKGFSVSSTQISRPLN